MNSHAAALFLHCAGITSTDPPRLLTRAPPFRRAGSRNTPHSFVPGYSFAVSLMVPANHTALGKVARLSLLMLAIYSWPHAMMFDWIPAWTIFRITPSA